MIDALSRIRGSLMAGAIGDALGAPIEFHSLAAIRSEFGLSGLTDYASRQWPIGTITDDTQMTLFTAEGIFDAFALDTNASDAAILESIRQAYLRWYRTQTERYSSCGSGLIAMPELWFDRVNGPTCVNALRCGGHGSTRTPLNDRKGCGGVMRVAPIGLVFPRRRAFTLAAEAAAITHGHATGFLSAGAFAAMLADITAGADVRSAAVLAIDELLLWKDHEETLAAISRAIEAADQGTPSPEVVETLGKGFVAEEALGIALYAATVACDIEDGLLLAVNHGGDSDSTGSIAGNLLGALHGVASLPCAWADAVELASTIDATAKCLSQLRETISG